jgi:hypothetical protein
MEIYQYFDTRYPRANTYWQIPRIYTDILFHFEFTSYNKYELRVAKYLLTLTSCTIYIDNIFEYGCILNL